MSDKAKSRFSTQLSQKEKQDVIRELIRKDPRKTGRQIGKTLGICHKTVLKVRREMEEKGEIERLVFVVDTLGRKCPAYKPRAICVAEIARGRRDD